MTDTATRLRDYLQATANTVPDDAESPGLDELATPRRHRVWPVLLAAAAIVAVLALTVPLLTRLNDKAGPPADQSTADLRSDLKIPYILTTAGQRTLHDGQQTAPVPNTAFNVSGRVEGGWLAMTMDKPGGTSQLGILKPGGGVTPIGPPNSRGVAISPDRTQIVTTVPAGKGKTRVVVVDIASNKQVAAVTLPHQTTVLWAWNKDGIWLAEDYKVGAQPMVWLPGAGQPTQLTVADFDLGLVAPAGTDKVLVTTRRGDAWCLKVGTLQGNKLDFERQYCGNGGRAIYPVLSPDGRTMIHTELKIAVDVETGKVTKVRLPDELLGYPLPVFEDATHLIAVPPRLVSPPTPLPTKGQPPSQNQSGNLAEPVYRRCDVESGSCEVFTTPRGTTLITLINP